MNRVQLIRILGEQDRSTTAAIVRTSLSLGEPIYRSAVRARNALFDLGVRRPRGLGRPVISVGNITTGGTGKTPLVMDLISRAVKRGIQPAVLLRGYRASASGSDEAALLRGALGPSVPVQAQPDRFRAAAAVLEIHPDVELFVLDDGFQHRQVIRDLDLVLVDATEPFGYGHVLPRGLLREPVSSLDRADAVIVTHATQVESPKARALDQQIEQVTGQSPLAHTAHRWSSWLDRDGRSHPPETLSSLKVVGACGIGNPAAFIQALQNSAGQVCDAIQFEDHHNYSGKDIHRMIDRAVELGADAIVTTEKDWIKIDPLLTPKHAMPIYRPVLCLQWLDGELQFEELLRSRIEAWSGALIGTANRAREDPAAFAP